MHRRERKHKPIKRNTKTSRNKLYINSVIQTLNEEEQTRLELNRLSFTDIPTQIYKLSNLTLLDLSKNNIRKCDQLFPSLPHFEVLNLSYNSIYWIHDDIGNLSKLTCINFSKNIIQQIPSTISKLTNLENLMLCNNKIRTMPFRSLYSLTKLESINLNRNIMEVVPPGISKLRNLKFLTVANNELRYFPWEELRSLDINCWISLNYNKFATYTAETIKVAPFFSAAKFPPAVVTHNEEDLLEFIQIQTYLYKDNRLVP